MNSGIRLAGGLALAGVAVYAAARIALRANRAWQNMKIIESVDTGSVWTTE